MSHAYAQMPYEAVEESEYRELLRNLKPLQFHAPGDLAAGEGEGGPADGWAVGPSQGGKGAGASHGGAGAFRSLSSDSESGSNAGLHADADEDEDEDGMSLVGMPDLFCDADGCVVVGSDQSDHLEQGQGQDALDRRQVGGSSSVVGALIGAATASASRGDGGVCGDDEDLLPADEAGDARATGGADGAEGGRV